MPVTAPDGTRGVNVQTWIYCGNGHQLWTSERAYTATTRYASADWLADDNKKHSDAPAARSACPVCGSAVLLMAGVTCPPGTVPRW